MSRASGRAPKRVRKAMAWLRGAVPGRCFTWHIPKCAEVRVHKPKYGLSTTAVGGYNQLLAPTDVVYVKEAMYECRTERQAAASW
jgi:hypothetical protein